MWPEGFVQVTRALRGSAVLVVAIDAIEVDPRLAFGAAERLRADPQLVVQPLDKRLDLNAGLDIKAMNESQHGLLRKFSFLAGELTPRPRERVVVLGHHPLLERNDGVVGDLDLLRAHLRAALGDVAHANTGARFDQLQSVVAVQRMHFQRREANEKPRPSKALLIALVVANDVADVLAQEALDALVELLYPVH